MSAGGMRAWLVVSLEVSTGKENRANEKRWRRSSANPGGPHRPST